MVWRYALLFFGVFACSTSALFIKASHTDPMVLTAIRLTLSALLLTPFYLSERKRHWSGKKAVPFFYTLPPAAVLAFHLSSWSYGARMTAVAQSTLIVNLVPVAMPFFSYWMSREKITGREIAGTVLAVIGLLILSLKDLAAGGGNFWGNLVCLVSMLLFAAYLALGRKNRDFPSVWLYVIPMYIQAAAVCLVLASPKLGGFAFASLREWGLMLCLACIPTIIGHSILNRSMRSLRGQIVSLCNVAQFVFAGVMGFLIFGELPNRTYYLASAFVVAGVGLVILGAKPDPIPSDEPA